jgi:hypothetical protein
VLCLFSVRDLPFKRAISDELDLMEAVISDYKLATLAV